MTSLFDKLAAEEEAFFSSDFLSPVLQGQPVRVRIAGIIVNFEVRPKKFEGWGVFRSVEQKTAKFIRHASMTQRQQYLDLFPRVSLIVVSQTDDGLFGIPANQGDGRIRVQGYAPISLATETRVFDTVDVRWDGEHFWYDRHANFRSSKFAIEMRDLLTAETDPKDVQISGITPEERRAYQFAFDLEVEAKKDRKEERLKAAVERAGGTYHSYVERGNTFTVEISVDGRKYHPVVDSNTLRAASAGICLSGGDRDFDLQSLVTVYREGQNRHRIHRW